MNWSADASFKPSHSHRLGFDQLQRTGGKPESSHTGNGADNCISVSARRPGSGWRQPCQMPRWHPFSRIHSWPCIIFPRTGFYKLSVKLKPNYDLEKLFNLSPKNLDLMVIILLFLTHLGFGLQLSFLKKWNNALFRDMYVMARF